MLIKQLDLLEEVKQRHPDGVIEGLSRRKGSKNVTLIELGGKDFRKAEMVSLLEKYWQPAEDDVLYVINLEGIDVLTPSAAKILVDSAPDIASNYKKPIVFTNVREMAREGLHSEACRLNPARTIWAMDEDGNAHIVGEIPNKLQGLLDLLEEKGSASASQLAALQEGKTSRKAVGNISVYLQKLFGAGLVGREKITALEREDAKRGWTYGYRTAPTIKRNSSPESYIRIP